MALENARVNRVNQAKPTERMRTQSCEHEVVIHNLVVWSSILTTDRVLRR